MSTPTQHPDAPHPNGHDHVHAHSSVFSRHPLLTGVAVAVGSLLPHTFLSPEASLGLAALLVALIAGIYFGFAVVNGSGRQQWIEFNVASMFAVSALLGLLYWPVLLAVAYFAHAAWDLAHHNRARFSLVSIPQWYVPWCVVIDVIIGAGLLAVWRANGVI